jgi:hypothetical protein
MEARIVPRSRDEFVAAMEQFRNGTNESLVDIFLEQGALCCRDSMIFTPPIVKAGGDGMSKEAKFAGEMAIQLDVKSVMVGERSGSVRAQRGRLFKKLGSASFNNNPSKFWKLASANSDLFAGNGLWTRMFGNGFGSEKGFKKLKNYFGKIGQQEASDIFNKPTIESTEQVRQIHETARKRFGGRIVKNGGPGIEFWQRAVVKDEVLEAYINQRIKMVGRIKAGWVDTLNKLPKPKFKMGGRSRANAGRSQIPLWIKRHAKSDGYVQMTRREVSELVFELTLGNRIGDLDFVATDADTKNLVYGNRVKQMPLMLQHMMDAHAERFNRRHKL